jgi:hypothetical protein
LLLTEQRLIHGLWIAQQLLRGQEIVELVLLSLHLLLL